MAIYLYLSMVPESLVASMLPPEEFGSYLAVGTKKQSRGQAMFFELAPGFQSEHFKLSLVPQRCVPHPDGTPKHSVYLAIYRVLEHVPLEALRRLWLVTRDGRAMSLEQGPVPSEFRRPLHLYQEVCPVHPLIASSLAPPEFCRFITDPARPIHVPRICFVDLQLAGLALDPRRGSADNLPYEHLDHLRECLTMVEPGTDKHTKTVDRIQPQQFPYRCIETGFFVGDQQGLLCYPFPSRAELENKHYLWWRSASL